MQSTSMRFPGPRFGKKAQGVRWRGRVSRSGAPAMVCAGTHTHMHTHIHTRALALMHTNLLPSIFLISSQTPPHSFLSPSPFLSHLKLYLSVSFWTSSLSFSPIPFPSLGTWGLLLLLRYSELISASGPLYLLSLCLQVSFPRDLEKGITYLV